MLKWIIIFMDVSMDSVELNNMYVSTDNVEVDKMDVSMDRSVLWWLNEINLSDCTFSVLPLHKFLMKMNIIVGRANPGVPLSMQYL